jgi:small subunit ribosomal protein S3
LGGNKTWLSQWYAKAGYSSWVCEDIAIRRFLKHKLYGASVSKIELERTARRLRVKIFAARPGTIIGKKGTEVDKLRQTLSKMTKVEVLVDINEVRKPELDAQLVAENVAQQLERRVAFRRAMKKCVLSSMKFGAKGIKIACAGRLGGAEIARSEWYREGRVPLHTLRADIDYGFATAKTAYGIIGVKVLMFHGEVLPEKKV